METKRNLTGREKAGYGLGAVAKDMVYMLSASYVLYYFQDIMGVNAIAMGIILLGARIFDAFNDPIMGVIVAKTKTRFGKFRPWLLIGTLTNAVVLYLMFACPPSLDGAGLTAYVAVTYILWGVTYTMMDIPFWSMIPAFTKGGKEREGLTTLARSCSGVGSALIQIFAIAAVQAIGKAVGGSNANEIERLGFQWLSLVVAIIFVVFIVITVLSIKEKSTVDMEAASLKDMFGSLIHNDQAMAIVVTIVLVDIAMYITSNLVIYFFKYDLGGTAWFADYTWFNTIAGGSQILTMMILYPVMRNALKLANTKIFYCGLTMSVIGYGILLACASLGCKTLFVFIIPGVFIMAASGMNNILITIFLANTVDYGEIKNGRRDESVIFSMQTFVVKLSSGVAAFVASITLGALKLSSAAVKDEDKVVDFSKNVDLAQRSGLRMVMTVIPILVLIVAFVWFKAKYKLNDEKVLELAEQVTKLHENKKQADA